MTNEPDRKDVNQVVDEVEEALSESNVVVQSSEGARTTTRASVNVDIHVHTGDKYVMNGDSAIDRFKEFIGFGNN